MLPSAAIRKRIHFEDLAGILPYFVRHMAHCQTQRWHDLVMDALSCTECRAIYLELQEALSVFAVLPGVGIDPAQLGEWILSLNDKECARIRET
jgi:hypothetical protein